MNMEEEEIEKAIEEFKEVLEKEEVEISAKLE
jgi:hypothetical protein